MVTHVPAEEHGDERGALLSFLEEQRGGIRRAVLGLTDEQACAKPSASELSLAGLVKHVAETEQGWIARARGAEPTVRRDESNWHECFALVGAETVASQLAYWEEVAAGTEAFARSVPSLDDTFPLPDQPWFPPGGRVSVRWVLLHLIRETARHAGHADIIRESLDGKTAFELVALAAR
ncbi:putative damage-inducible protein DinB [Streptomyces sp. SAI-135]|uniref:DinB family protein n=1 Tax=unclassified Streptomyces TaxID=2593676 RepID=UPI00247430F8|nr:MULTISPECIES: DinB family protein [unclassified Streptomyces]MDH6517437.1 putative damage-inducible protein DinB [Streptomyces sp. SAI-090]MDH6586334.1 putative damage-inducible protein DinB [Streptomyces sp. SAI-133]MDH6618474.1 putative damage-inducible protein DinB [Streptomyces sp. SAI-135]